MGKEFLVGKGHLLNLRQKRPCLGKNLLRVSKVLIRKVFQTGNFCHSGCRIPSRGGRGMRKKSGGKRLHNGLNHNPDSRNIGGLGVGLGKKGVGDHRNSC